MESVLVFFLLAIFTFSHSSTLLPLDCQELGFDSASLDCSKCDLLHENVKDRELWKECKMCCNRPSSNSAADCISIKLEICPWKTRSFPQISAFIEQKEFKYEGVSHDFVPGLFPTLYLEDSSGSLIEKIRIDSWTTDDIEEFIVERLKKTGASGR